MFFDYDLIMITLVFAVLIMNRFFLFLCDYDEIMIIITFCCDYL